MQSIEDILVDIAPQFRGHLTPRGLIEPKGTIEFKTNYSQVGGVHAGFVCRLISPNYTLEVGFTSTHFYILRNDRHLEVLLNPIYRPNGDVHFFAIWDLNRLSLIVLDESYHMAVREIPHTNRVEDVKRRMTTLTTPPTIPPNNLLSWARQQTILPNIEYKTLELFNETVVSSLESIDDVISTLSSRNPFWDITYDGSRIHNRSPKREPDIHPTVHSLLYYIAIAKGFEITPEYQIAGGRLDFLVTGCLSNGSQANVCIEFKLAHSADLIDGLLKQLPAYMKVKGCNFGIFSVMYFKGKHFDEPKEYDDSHSLRIDLEILRRKTGLSNIRTIILDAGYKTPPSRL